MQRLLAGLRGEERAGHLDEVAQIEQLEPLERLVADRIALDVDLDSGRSHLRYGRTSALPISRSSISRPASVIVSPSSASNCASVSAMVWSRALRAGYGSMPAARRASAFASRSSRSSIVGRGPPVILDGHDLAHETQAIAQELYHGGAGREATSAPSARAERATKRRARASALLTRRAAPWHSRRARAPRPAPQRRCTGPGGPHRLQNGCAVARAVAGGFDSHTPLPLLRHPGHQMFRRPNLTAQDNRVTYTSFAQNSQNWVYARRSIDGILVKPLSMRFSVTRRRHQQTTIPRYSAGPLRASATTFSFLT